MVENTYLWNSASLPEHGIEDKCVGGVGGTTINHIVDNRIPRII